MVTFTWRYFSNIQLMGKFKLELLNMVISQWMALVAKVPISRQAHAHVWGPAKTELHWMELGGMT